MRRSKILLQIGNWPIVFQTLLVSFVLYRYNVFHSWGNLPSFRQSLTIFERGLQIEFPNSFIIWILSMSCPCALSGSKWLIILVMSQLKKFIESSCLFVSWGRSVGKTLLLLNRGDWEIWSFDSVRLWIFQQGSCFFWKYNTIWTSNFFQPLTF